MIAAPSVNICSDCVGLCTELIRSDQGPQQPPPPQPPAGYQGADDRSVNELESRVAAPEAPPKEPAGLRCSFCEKPQTQVKKLIAGPNVFVCNECIDLCQNLFGEEKST